MKNAKSLLEKLNKLKNVEESNSVLAKNIYKQIDSSISVIRKNLKSLISKDFAPTETLDSFEDWVDEHLSELERSVDEGVHFHTKIRQLESTIHPRKVKLAVREAKRMVECMMDTKHPSPNPVSNEDLDLLKSSQSNLGAVVESLNKVRVQKRPMKEEDSEKDDKEFFSDETQEDQETDSEISNIENNQAVNLQSIIDDAIYSDIISCKESYVDEDGDLIATFKFDDEDVVVVFTVNDDIPVAIVSDEIQDELSEDEVIDLSELDVPLIDGKIDFSIPVDSWLDGDTLIDILDGEDEE